MYVLFMVQISYIFHIALKYSIYVLIVYLINQLKCYLGLSCHWWQLYSLQCCPVLTTSCSKYGIDSHDLLQELYMNYNCNYISLLSSFSCVSCRNFIENILLTQEQYVSSISFIHFRNCSEIITCGGVDDFL